VATVSSFGKPPILTLFEILRTVDKCSVTTLQPPIPRRPPDTPLSKLQIPRPEQRADDTGDVRAMEATSPKRAKAEDGAKQRADPEAKLRETTPVRSDEDIAVKTPERATTPRVITQAPMPLEGSQDDEPPLTQAGGTETQNDPDA
jgi:hypothetical protein